MKARSVLIALWMIVIGWPMSRALWLLAQWETEPSVHGEALHTSTDVFLTTATWAIGVAAVSVCLALLPARWLGSLSRVRRSVGVSILMLGLLLPTWAVYYAWWASSPPGTWLYDVSVEATGVGLVRNVMLAIALVAGTWPLAVCCVMPACARWSAERSEQMRMDGATAAGLQCARIRVECPGLLVGFILSAILVASWTTAFDLAGVFTIANELRARSALGMGLTSLIWTSWPVCLAALCGGAMLWWWIGRGCGVLAPGHRVVGTNRGGRVQSVVVTGVLVAAPFGLLVALWWQINAASDPGGDLLGPVTRTVLRSAIVGGVAAAIVLGGRSCWNSRLCVLAGVIWVASAFLPAALVGAAVTDAWGGTVQSSGAAWVLALCVRGGAVGIIASLWLERSTPHRLRDLHMLDRPPWWCADPITRSAALAAAMVAVAWSVSDIAIAARVAPPMAEPPLAVTLLNAMHYQRPETVVRVLILLPVPVIVAGVLVLLCVIRIRPRAIAGPLLLAMTVLPMACQDESQDAILPPVPVVGQTGLPGRSPGRFDMPRGIASDGHGGVYVVDKSARVQHVDAGDRVELWWMMPDYDNGKPTGISVVPGGRIAVADTHEYRVSVFDESGQLERTFGEYGTDPGQFIYPTDIVVDEASQWYVSEYGGNDRIQVLDSAATPLRVLGGPGSGPGEFRRPQSMDFSVDGQVLWVADSCNHRVQGIDPNTGEQVAELGTGWLRYPYGVAALPDETVVVSEFGGHRLSRWSPAGDRLGAWGGWGRGLGRLSMPWGITYDPSTDEIQLLDTGNARILRIPRSALDASMRH